MAGVDEMYLENLDEFINDENKVLTYKWLSRTLSVHVNQAKQMLCTFVQKQRNEQDNDKLYVTYFVSGLVDDKGSKVHWSKIVPEENLDFVKASFSPVTSCHIYSVQRSKLKDTSSLYMSDYELLKEHIVNPNKFSAIKCLAAKQRSSDEMERLQRLAQPTSAAPVFGQNGTSHAKSADSKQSKKPSGGIAGMFAAKPAAEKAAGNAEKPTLPDDAALETKATGSINKQVKTDAKTKGKAGGVMSFFSKQANKPKSESKVEAPKAAQTEPKESPKPASPPSSPREASEVVTKKSPPPAQKKKKQEEIKSKGKKNKKQDPDDDVRMKKRRRLKVMEISSSSSSSSEDEMQVDDENPVPSPAREPSSPPTPPPSLADEEEEEEEDKVDDSQSDIFEKEPVPAADKEQHKQRIKKRKMVSKTYVNDEGFMVTEKVYEEESTDASEAEEPVKSKPRPAPPKQQEKGKKSPVKKSSPDKGSKKQTNLMSFFKKK